MIKKIFTIIALALLPLVSMAQVAVGGWKMYSPFTGVEKMAETKTYVYYISGGALFRVDKHTTEVQSFNSSNTLNDNDATGVFADATERSVVLAYASGNMDRLYDDGTIRNLSDIKDAQSVASHTINDIAFSEDKFYVATNFGVVTYGNRKNEVMETAFLPKAVTSIGASKNIVALYSDDMVYVAPATQRLKKLSDLTPLSSLGQLQYVESLKVFGDRCIFISMGGTLNRIMLAGEGYADSQRLDWFTIQGSSAHNVTSLAHTSVYSIDADNGFCYNKDGVFTLSSQGEIVKIDNVTFSASDFYTFNGSLSSVWVGSENGVKEMDYTSTPAKELIGYISGSELTIKQIQSMSLAPDGRIYMNMLFTQRNMGIPNTELYPAKVIVFKDGKFFDASPDEVTMENNKRGKKAPYKLYNTFRVQADPDDADAYYVGTFFEGVYHIKNKKEAHKYWVSSAGFTHVQNWGCLVPDCDVDKFGNLWVYAAGENGDSYNRLFVLPAEKRNKTTTTPSDWRAFPLKGVTFDNWCASVLGCRKSSRVVVAHGIQSRFLFVVDTKNTPSVSDDVVHIVERQIDQDGKEWPLTYGFNCLTEDADGKIWVGTDVGVFEIPDIESVNSSTATIRRMKIPRNDGTNLADYLLDNVCVSAIAVDAANRKWIATNGSGVYLVSPTGDAIIEHYTVDNSILPSNNVYSVVCDPNSNKVYFGTPNGLVEYSSTSSPGAENYDDVYAYPNPVRPDFGGWITVTGLMDNSLVKITDAAGNVFHQGKSDGGMFVWDGCNASGERVKTGIYYVLASQNATGQSEACVTKIMVVN